jgi:hypothetical protein
LNPRRFAVFQGRDCGFLIASSLVDAAAQEKGFGRSRLEVQEFANLSQRFIVSALLIKLAGFLE